MTAEEFPDDAAAASAPHDIPRGTATLFLSPADGARAGGDWCEVVTISQHAVAVTIGDVSGHGESAAATMAVIRAAVLEALATTHVPSDVLAAANGIAFGIGEGIIVTAIVAIVDYRTATLTFANAGHPPPLVCTKRVHDFLAHGPADLPLGIFPHHQAANFVFALPHDALVVLYTDGITEHARDPVRGESELVAAARWLYDRRLENEARAIAEYVFQHGRGDDDAATIVFRLAPDRR